MSDEVQDPPETDPPRQPFRPRGGTPREVPRPDLPEDEDPDLPRGVMSEIRSAVDGGAREVALALSTGATAIDEERPDVARRYLAWARQQAPRSGAIREALGVALYHDGAYRDALSELRAYRRLSGRLDQNHVIADCLRALGRPVSEVAEDVEAMLEDDDVPAERRIEGVLVLAGRIADDGDLEGGRAVLRRADDLVHELDRSGDELPEALVRLWYVEGDLAQRDHDPETARRWFRQVIDAEQESYDARERLESL